jgi:hypothetical protein
MYYTCTVLDRKLGFRSRVKEERKMIEVAADIHRLLLSDRVRIQYKC